MFDADFDDLSNWMDFAFNHKTNVETTNYTVESQKGNLHIEVPEKYTIVYAIYGKDMPFADVQIDVDTETTGPDLNNIAMVCRASDEGWYHLSIASSGLWYIYRYEIKNGYTLLRNGGSTAIHMIQRNNHLTALCKGDTLALYVNDVKVGSVQDNAYVDGRVGVAVASMDSGGTGIRFKNLKVRLPDPANPPGGKVAPTVAPVPTKPGAKYKWPLPPLPGTSWAGAGMQTKALVMIVPALIVNAPADCQDFSNVNTAFLQENQPVTVDNENNLTGGEWVEQWTFNYCGVQSVYQVTFSANGSGPVNVGVRAIQ
jgi:hypothetical protein